MSAADAFVGELLSWAPRRLIPQTALAFAITVLLYPVVPTPTNRFLVILPSFIISFLLWSQFGYRLKSIFEGRTSEVSTSDFMRTESFITGILEGERSFAEDIVGEGVNARKAAVFIASAVAGEAGFYGLIISLMFALNRVYLVLSGFDALGRLSSDALSIAAFAVIVSLAVSFLMQVRKMDFQGGGEKPRPSEETTFALNIVRRYMVDNTVRLARQASPILRGFLPLISVPTIVEPFAMDSVIGLYRPDDFKKTIEQAKKEGLITPLEQGDYDALMEADEDGSGLTDISVLSGEELLHVSFPGAEKGQPGRRLSKCSFKLKTGVGFLNVAAFKACYQGWEPRTAFRTPKIRRTTVFYVFGMGNESLIAKLKTRFKLKLVIMANQAIPCEE